MKEIVRIGCGAGFWGDSAEGPKQLVNSGEIDYLVLDYLAEVTMSILQKQRARDPSAGYARDFVQLMGDIFPRVVRDGIRVMANAGGVNPVGCRDAVLANAPDAQHAMTIRRRRLHIAVVVLDGIGLPGDVGEEAGGEADAAAARRVVEEHRPVPRTRRTIPTRWPPCRKCGNCSPRACCSRGPSWD